MAKYSVVHIPFEFRHTCWFCGEPSFKCMDFVSSPASEHKHLALAIPVCKECASTCARWSGDVFTAKQYIKKTIARRYKKELAIGLNWTEKELAESDFEGAAFAGFKKSAWLMHTIAKSRVNFEGWQLEVDGILIGMEAIPHFEFDGVKYNSLAEAVEHYCSAWYLDSELLNKTVLLTGKEQFGFALRLCRPYLNIRDSERKAALAEIAHRLTELDQKI